MRCTQQCCGSLATLLMWLQDAAVPEDPRTVEAAAALQEGALRREVDLLRSRAQLLAAAGRVSFRAPVGARHPGAPWQCSIQTKWSVQALLVALQSGMGGKVDSQGRCPSEAGWSDDTQYNRAFGSCSTMICPSSERLTHQPPPLDGLKVGT